MKKEFGVQFRGRRYSHDMQICTDGPTRKSLLFVRIAPPLLGKIVVPCGRIFEAETAALSTYLLEPTTPSTFSSKFISATLRYGISPIGFSNFGGSVVPLRKMQLLPIVLTFQPERATSNLLEWTLQASRAQSTLRWCWLSPFQFLRGLRPKWLRFVLGPAWR